MLNREAIAERIPHAGAMCLLESVSAWDAASIRCTATSHRDPANPLREGSGLPAWAAIEYAAQAAAVHGSLLLEAARPRAAVLAQLRDVRITMPRLDNLPGDLTIAAWLRHRDPAGAIYDFAAEADGANCVVGRFTLMFTGPA